MSHTYILYREVLYLSPVFEEVFIECFHGGVVVVQHAPVERRNFLRLLRQFNLEKGRMIKTTMDDTALR